MGLSHALLAGVAASGIEVSGTPTVFMGETTGLGFEGARIVGAQPYAVFQAKLDELLK
jgi:protein-disulfide isomerase